MKGSFYSYFDMSARQPNLNNYKFVYFALSGKDEALRKNCLVQLTTEDNHTRFFFSLLPPLPETIYMCKFSHLVTRLLKRLVDALIRRTQNKKAQFY